MAWTRADLEKIQQVLLNPTKKVTFSDGRSSESHSLDELRRLRTEMKAEVVADESRTVPKKRFTIGRMGR
ncbi:hypothetical protein [Sphingobium sp. LF-16]|uniref:hypothetical protein n=1 Tax=Sphingobium sp. LF-16 TaxID=2185111 RepID=UPI000F080038|nr:hypothetical protein [Sphingobium sp. LF-16]